MARILILDDEADTLEVIQTLLESAGYEVLATTDPDKALDILQTQPADLFIQDLLRPRMDGVEFLHRFKADERLHGIPVLVITGFSRGDCARYLKDHGLDLDRDVAGHLHKQTELGKLLDAVAIVLEKYGKQLPSNELRRRARESAECTMQLEQTISDFDQFSYSVKEYLPPPLRLIGDCAKALQVECGPSLSEDGRRFLDVISKTATRTREIIDGLAAFSRLCRMELRVGVVCVDELVDEVLREIKSDAQARSIQWTIQPLSKVFADRALLRQVWLNLLSNAVKYTREGERAEIEVGCRSKEAELEFYVGDNGIGFDPLYANTMFGLFERLHHSSPLDGEGIGIGLALVRRIIARHGGKTWAEGKVNGGATIHFTLPQSATPLR